MVTLSSSNHAPVWCVVHVYNNYYISIATCTLYYCVNLQLYVGSLHGATLLFVRHSLLC